MAFQFGFSFAEKAKHHYNTLLEQSREIRRDNLMFLQTTKKALWKHARGRIKLSSFHLVKYVGIALNDVQWQIDNYLEMLGRNDAKEFLKSHVSEEYRHEEHYAKLLNFVSNIEMMFGNLLGHLRKEKVILQEAINLKEEMDYEGFEKKMSDFSSVFDLERDVYKSLNLEMIHKKIFFEDIIKFIKTNMELTPKENIAFREYLFALGMATIFMLIAGATLSPLTVIGDIMSLLSLLILTLSSSILLSPQFMRKVIVFFKKQEKNFVSVRNFMEVTRNM